MLTKPPTVISPDGVLPRRTDSNPNNSSRPFYPLTIVMDVTNVTIISLLRNNSAPVTRTVVLMLARVTLVVHSLLSTETDPKLLVSFHGVGVVLVVIRPRSTQKSHHMSAGLTGQSIS